METKQIAILGTGSMGKAILSGILAAGTSPADVRVTTKSKATADAIFSNHGVQATSLESNSAANSSAAKDADLVILAVKPNMILETLSEVAAVLKPDCLVVSVAAGITTAAMEEQLSGNEAVVRAMPNTPSVVGLGVTGISKGSNVSAKQLDLAIELFSSVGKVLVVDESKIDALSTISGSGPAYVFYFAEKLITAAKYLGFSEQEASLMVKETFLGSATLLATSSSSPEELRQQVTSPNGTTMQATGRFDAADLERVFIEATEAALARAKELGRIKP
ncbi:MAG: pyrroline-5-carboxylate reductase [Rhodoluna sp.]|nr:pyrroline-5-carboxylate reductase [Rhodoluna sp.]